MRPLLLVAAALLTACAPAPPPPEQQPKPAPDLTVQPWYEQSTEELVALNRRASDLDSAGKYDEAAGVITQTQPLVDRLLSAAHPTLAAMEAASDHDDLYGRMLLRNGNVGWARMAFQKNVVRWKNWKPETPETAARLKAAQASVADCDRRLQ